MIATHKNRSFERELKLVHSKPVQPEPEPGLPYIHLDHSYESDRFVVWAAKKRRRIPRRVEPLFHLLCVVLLAGWCVWDEFDLWLQRPKPRRADRAVNWIIFCTIGVVVFAVVFDILAVINTGAFDAMAR